MTIRRVSDFDIFSNEQLEKITKKILQRENMKLFDVVDSDKKVELIKKELKVQGYQVKIEPFGDKFKIFAIIPEKLKYEEAIESGSFKKLAWGRYSFQRESSIGMFKYDYDDGSIWRVITGEDGLEYLVKEVSDNNEDEVLRVKIASNENIAINDENVKTVLNILYDNLESNEFVNDILTSNIKQQVYNILNDKLTLIIDKTIEENHFIKSADYTSSVHGIVKTAIDSKALDSKKQLKELICKYTNQFILAAGKMPKLFD